jgi:hypothetical protein
MNPIFVHLMTKYAEMHDAGLDRTPEASRLFCEAMTYAPEDFKKLAHDKAVEMGLMPARPDGYGDEGEPLYNMEAMIERLGIDPDDIPDHLKEQTYHGAVHRAH